MATANVPGVLVALAHASPILNVPPTGVAKCCVGFADTERKQSLCEPRAGAASVSPCLCEQCRDLPVPSPKLGQVLVCQVQGELPQQVIKLLSRRNPVGSATAPLLSTQ